ncbi:hypothetical protein GCM10011313_00380 [Mycetocola zhadangensis]|nr:hypothetical protein GCM10011313_00380 [Mycetocola zhadangensis]
MIFALVSVGIVHSLLAVTIQVRDSKAREIATNLASQEIDSVRSTDNLFTLLDETYTPDPIGGQNFTVTRSAQWVTDPDADSVCGGVAGTTARDLQYKLVSVTVTWDGMRNRARPVYADTLIAPGARVSGPQQSTILVYVENPSGGGTPGVTIETDPAVTPAPTPTDAQGCSYIPKVTPGTYKVTVTTPNFVDAEQKKPPTQTVTVQEGESGAAFFRAAPQQPLEVTYASNYTDPAVVLPDNLTTSFMHESDPIYSVDGGNSKTLTHNLYPFAEPYKAVAGRYVEANDGTAGCRSTNPAEWPTTVVGAETLESAPLESAAPGTGAKLSVPMGVVSIAKESGIRTITAVSQSAGPAGTADPGCAALTMTYTFTVTNGNSTILAALPFGSWQLYKGDSAASPEFLVGLTPKTRGSVSLGGIVTLDPRDVL